MLLPAQLQKFALTLDEVMEAIRTNNTESGGRVMRRGSMSFVVSGRGALEGLEDLRAPFIKTSAGTPVYLRAEAQPLGGWATSAPGSRPGRG